MSERDTGSSSVEGALPMHMNNDKDKGGNGPVEASITRIETSDPLIGSSTNTNHVDEPSPRRYRTYKRRWYGLLQLVLLNIVVSWDWLSYAPVSNTAATFFDTSPAVIAWLSTAFLFAFAAASPFTLWALHSYGPKTSCIAASTLVLLGNWIRYGATRSTTPSFGGVMFGQILIGLAQPFVLAAPTRYSDLWFSPRGRVAATALASLANPFGGALGQLINPFLVNVPSDIPNMTLYVAIISTVASLPSYVLPSKPPTPVAPSSEASHPPLREQIVLLYRNRQFWLIAIPFAVYVGFFNSISSLLTQILTPYGFSENDSGIGGAILILVGLVAAAVTSPLVDRFKIYYVLIRILAPIIGLSYLAFIFAPATRTDVAPYIILAVLGASSFSLLPVALETLVEVTYPVGPELSSVISWAAGQVLGGIFIIVSDALQDSNGDPPGNYARALIFQAVIALVVVPLALMVGVGTQARRKRLDVDVGREI